MPSSADDSFDLYRNEFKSLIQQIEKDLRTNEEASAPISDLLQTCQELIPQMELEMRATTDASIKQERKDILQACKLQLLSYKALETQTNKTKLWDETTERNYRREAMQLQDVVGRQNSQLQSALKSIRETEQVGSEIASELARNRKNIESAHGNVHSLSSMTEQANGLLKSMNRKWWQFW